jgi:hypothetical protein
MVIPDNRSILKLQTNNNNNNNNSISLHANLTANGQLQSEHVKKNIEIKHTVTKPK